jgi:hypothetical protein
MLVAVPWLTACDGGEKKADLPFAPVREAMDKDAQAFAAYFQTIKGQPVTWTGRVTEVLRQRGDDYVEEAYVFVDMDASGREAADVTFQIPVSAVDKLQVGQPINYVAVIREFERNDNAVVLKLELKQLN